jgi:hypothetical protein
MSRWGCIGLVVGSLLGALLLVLLAWLVQPTTPVVAVQPASVTPNLTLFLSEQGVSRFASQALGKPAVINFEPGGQAVLTAPVDLGGLEPVVNLGLSLERRGREVVSQLHWLQIGFLRLPANWLPPELVALGAQPGQQLTRQIPAQFSLVSLTTTPDGINLQFAWSGQ